MSIKKAISADRIFDGEDFHQNCAILIKDGVVVDVCSKESVPLNYELEQCSNGILAPGFIDWQVNGGGGILFNNDTSVEALRTIVKGHHTGGTTSLLPTIVSDTLETRQQAVGCQNIHSKWGERRCRAAPRRTIFSY